MARRSRRVRRSRKARKSLSCRKTVKMAGKRYCLHGKVVRAFGKRRVFRVFARRMKKA